MPSLTEIPCCFRPVKQVSNWCRGIRRDPSRIKDSEMRDIVRPGPAFPARSDHLAIHRRILEIAKEALSIFGQLRQADGTMQPRLSSVV